MFTLLASDRINTRVYY